MGNVISTWAPSGPSLARLEPPDAVLITYAPGQALDPDAYADAAGPLEKDVGTDGERGCGQDTMALHWLPVASRSEFCRQICLSPELESQDLGYRNFLSHGTCSDLGYRSFLGTHSRAGAPGFEGSVTVSDFAWQREGRI
jgi:hypothetical protein